MTEHTFYKFPSIDSMHNKVKRANKRIHTKQNFWVKPKLHGTNAAIVIEQDTGAVYAQSRNRILDIDSDNAGFAAFLDEQVLTGVVPHSTIIIYGEWAGKGIQENDAITRIDDKYFFPFCVVICNDDNEMNWKVEQSADYIEKTLELVFATPENMIPIKPLANVELGFSGDVEHLTNVENVICDIVDEFETVDPWVKDTFGVEGTGEGVVVSPDTQSWQEYVLWTFKAKTKAHSVNKNKKAANAKVVISQDVIDFADVFATEARFKQAVQEMDAPMEMKSMGKFLKWVNEDVLKESKDELEESELEWKQCAKEITNRARMWFMNNA